MIEVDRTKWEPWENTFTKLAHLVISEPEPYMLTEIDKTKVVCRCFYHTVVFTDKSIIVFTNEAGGMCPISLDYLEKAFNTPEGYDFGRLRGQLVESV